MRFAIRTVDDTASTNDDVKQAAEAGAEDGLVIRALRQSAGRGRQGRAWHSPEGNLYFSVLLRPALERRDYGLYSFVAALAVGDAVRSLLPEAQVELKWPNDVLVGGKKISGILLEAGEGYLVVGIGVNVRVAPENAMYPVTNLTDEHSDAAADTVLDMILGALGDWCGLLETAGFEPLRAAWLGRARRGTMWVRLPNEEFSGEFADLDEQGNLRVVLADGTARIVHSGDVFF